MPPGDVGSLSLSSRNWSSFWKQSLAVTARGFLSVLLMYLVWNPDYVEDGCHLAFCEHISDTYGIRLRGLVQSVVACWVLQEGRRRSHLVACWALYCAARRAASEVAQSRHQYPHLSQTSKRMYYHGTQHSFRDETSATSCTTGARLHGCTVARLACAAKNIPSPAVFVASISASQDWSCHHGTALCVTFTILREFPRQGGHSGPMTTPHRFHSTEFRPRNQSSLWRDYTTSHQRGSIPTEFMQCIATYQHYMGGVFSS